MGARLMCPEEVVALPFPAGLKSTIARQEGKSSEDSLVFKEPIEVELILRKGDSTRF